MSKQSPPVGAAIFAALQESDAYEKVRAARKVARDWRRGSSAFAFPQAMPERPGRPERPELLAPRMMPKRGRGQSLKGRIALFHAIAHIEFVAIDLALDIVGRFGGEMGQAFIADFLAVAAEEAMHFALIERHLASMGAGYGDLPVHDGLWQSAAETVHDPGARLAVVPMVLEARGLDVTPAMLDRVRAQGDLRGARILQRILDDEIRHVAAGARHFESYCRDRGLEADSHWKMLVARHFHGTLRPPFNDSARLAAGLSRELYAGVA